VLEKAGRRKNRGDLVHSFLTAASGAAATLLCCDLSPLAHAVIPGVLNGTMSLLPLVLAAILPIKSKQVLLAVLPGSCLYHTCTLSQKLW
jgi:hypothetical protein